MEWGCGRQSRVVSRISRIEQVLKWVSRKQYEVLVG